MHESYSFSNDIRYDDAHVIHGQEPNKHRNKKKQKLDFTKWALVGSATGIMIWVLLSATHKKPSHVSKSNVVDIRELTPAQCEQFFAPRPPPLTPEEQKRVDAYMIPCHIYAENSAIKLPPSSTHKISWASNAVKEAYVRGMEFTPGVASLVESYAWEMAPERKETILSILEHNHQLINTIDTDELTVPLTSRGTTGLEILITKHAKSNDIKVRQDIVHTIRSIVHKHPASVNMRTSLHNKETLCHVIAYYGVFGNTIDHDLFDIFIQYGNPRWDMTNDLYSALYGKYLKGSHCLTLLVQHQDLKFHQEPKKNNKDKCLLQKLATTCPIDDQDNYARTALHYAMLCGASTEIIHFLVNDLKANPLAGILSHIYFIKKYGVNRTVSETNEVSKTLNNAIQRLDQQEKEAKKPTEPFKGLDQES